MSTLANIRTKVRRLTGRPSGSQITDAQIDTYINDFFLYDLPNTVRLFDLHTNFEFMTEANVDQYDLRTMNILYNGTSQPAIQVYTNIQPPAFIAGYESFWSQDEEQFFRVYPKLADIVTTITGDGTPGPYSFTLDNTPILQNEVTVGAIDSTGATVQVVDSPSNRTTGTWVVINTATAVTGSINYVSGSGTITFSNIIPSGNEITVTSVPYSAGRPQALLFYDNTITLRPVPDAPYKVAVKAFIIPTQLVNNTDNPEIYQWWQYLAYGAAKKIFEDSQDMGGVQAIMPAFKEQERLVLRKTIVQNTTQRTATIYSEQGQYTYGNFSNIF